MSGNDEARKLVRELLQEALGNGNGHPAMVPPPPVAAVHRPSTWSQPAAPGEVIGNTTETVRIESDADLAAFVHRVLDQSSAVRAGRLRFTLTGPPAAALKALAEAEVTGLAVREPSLEEIFLDYYGTGSTR